MKLVATKIEMETVGKMSKLVIDNVDAISSDLTVLDSRLLLGNADIDVVALDGTGALVLIAIDRASDEQLLLKAVEAYSWCLEYPEAVRRLYPTADVSVARPPRVMFVVERMSDSFHRKVKQLGFPEVDCVEFRHLAIDGAEAVHFDTVVRLRRATLVAEDARPAASVVTAAPAPEHAPLEAGAGARATSVKLQKLLTADTTPATASRASERAAERTPVERPVAPMAVSAPAPAREPAVVVSMMNRAGRHAARLEEAALLVAPVPGTVTRRVHDAESTPESARTITVEPAAVAPMLELVVVPQPVVVPEPVIAAAPIVEPVAPVLETRAIELPVIEMPVLEVAAPQPIAVPEPVIVAAPLIEPALDVAPALEPAVEPERIAVPEPVVVESPVLELVVEEPVTAPDPAPAVVIEPVAEPALESVVAAVPEPVMDAAPAPDAAEPPRISFADLSKELLASTSGDRKPAAASKSVTPTRPLEPPASIKPAAGGGDRVSLADLSKELLGTPAAARIQQPSGPTLVRLQVPPVVEAPTLGQISVDAERSTPVLDLAPSVEAEPLTVAALVEAAAAQTVADGAAETPEAAKIPGLPQEFEGLKFPGDGVLTRQWIDFLNQMTAAK